MKALFIKGINDGIFRLFTGEILLRHETDNFKKILLLALK